MSLAPVFLCCFFLGPLASPKKITHVVREAGEWRLSGRHRKARAILRRACPKGGGFADCPSIFYHRGAALLAARLERELRRPEVAAALLEKHLSVKKRKRGKGAHAAGKATASALPRPASLKWLCVLELARSRSEAGRPKAAAAALWKLREKRQSFFWFQGMRLQGEALAKAGEGRQSAAAYVELADRIRHQELRGRFRFHGAEALLTHGHREAARPLLKKVLVDEASSSWAAHALPLWKKTYGRDLKLSVKKRRWRARRLLSGFHIEEAVKAYQGLVASKEGKGALQDRYGLARALLYAGRYKEGIEVARALYKEGYRKKKTGSLVRSFLRRLGRFGDVARFFSALSKRAGDPTKKANLLVSAADAWLEGGSYTKAHKLLKTVVGPKTGGKLGFVSAYLSMKVGKTARALKRFKRLSRSGGWRRAGRYWAGVCNLKLKQKQKAIRLFTDVARRRRAGYYGLLSRARLKALGQVTTADSSAMTRYMPILKRTPRRAVSILLKQPCGAQAFCPLQVLGWATRLGLLGEARRALRWFVSCLEGRGRRSLDRRPLSRNEYWLHQGCPTRTDLGRWTKDKVERRRVLSAVVRVARWADDEAMARRFLRELKAPLRSTPLPLERHIRSEHGAWGVRPSWIWSVMRVESAYNPMVLSWVGAMGFMQIMPHTARRIARALGVSPFDTSMLFRREMNIHFGAWYLGQLLVRFRGQLSLALAGYNGGPHNVALWLKLKGELPLDEFVEEIPFSETRRYVKKTLRWIWRYSFMTGDKVSDLVSLEMDSVQEDNIDF